ncbi:hypothetical protein FQN55_005876 [Onygenales sp. PD_40]|nr:hypothetical protein FQN55_005876 [Onygenales sp. PD_40]
MGNPPDDEHDIDVMWREALVEFHKYSGRDPNSFTELKVEDVIGKISQKKEKDEKKAARHGKAKDILQKTLTCIQTLGDLAAQGASMVFGPSTMCFNAVSYLITTAQNYSKIFAGVGELFERISAFLERFEVYVRSKSLGVEIDIHLRKIIHELLRSFMRICALSIKVSKESRILLALEVFSFGTDKGVQAELDVLEALVQRETGMSVALILESAKITEGKVTSGFAETKGSLRTLDGKVDGVAGQLNSVSNFLERREHSDRRKEADGASKRNREKIKQALKVDKENWRVDQEEFMRTRVATTGTWLETDPDFAAWVEGKDSSGPILALQAKEGFGKSFLSSTAVRHLFHLHPPGHQDTRVSIAYYFFQKDNKDEKSVNKALRAIIWQLTHNDVVYQKSVASACDKPEEFGSSFELWNQLVVQLSTKTEATFFIVLDGIDEAETETGHPLLQILRDVSLIAREKLPLRIRLFLTGRPRAFAEVQKETDISLTSIALGTKNQDDIIKYIDARMETMDILKKSDQPDIEELKSRIRTQLAEGAGGDFFKLDFMLTEISTKRRRKEIEEVLEHAGEDRSDTIAREIDRLNKSLGEEDIQELNDLLGFAIAAKRWPHIKTLEAVLLVKNGEGSLVPLEEQIQDKYSALFEISDDKTVSIRSDSIVEYFRKVGDASQDTGISTASSTLHVAEVAIIRRFLQNVCDNDLYSKFGFEEFFKRKLGNKAAQISVDLDYAVIQLLSICLKALRNEHTEKVDTLIEYWFYWFPDHLEEVDLALTAPSPKSEIGALLIKLFTEEEYINKFWSTDRLWMQSWWLGSDDYVDYTMKWFKDSAVVKGLLEEERQWVNGLTSNSKPDDDLLRPTAKVLAKRWLQSPGYDVSALVCWLILYTSKIKSRKDGSDRIFRASQLTTDQILELEIWAQAELGVTEKDSTWIVQMAATFMWCETGAKVMEFATAALELDPGNWLAQWCLARGNGIENRYKEALEAVARVIETFQTREELMEEERDFFYDEVLSTKAVWNSQLGEYDAAISTYLEIHNQQIDKYASMLSIIDILSEQGKYSDVVEHLQNMRSQTGSGGLNRLTAMFHYYAYHGNYHQTINKVGRSSNQFKLIKELYQDSIEVAMAKSNTPDAARILPWLRYYYGLSLFYNHESENSDAEGVAIWESNIDSKNNENDWIETMTMDKLASVYLERAKEVGFDGPIAEASLHKLESLCKASSGRDEGLISHSGRYLLARCYLLMGNKEKAMDTLKGDIKIGLDLLSDDDTDNDWQGYRRLATTLHHINDDVNALAAWSLLGPNEVDHEGGNTEENKEESKDQEVHEAVPEGSGGEDQGETPEIKEEAKSEGDDAEAEAVSDGTPKQNGDTPVSNEEDQVEGTAADISETTPTAETTDASPSTADSSEETRTGNLGNYCDGPCTNRWTYADDLYDCRDCTDVQFCETCLGDHEAVTLERMVCGKSHEFMHVPKWEEIEALKIPKGQVKVGEEIMSIPDWLNTIRREWGIAVTESEVKCAQQ